MKNQEFKIDTKAGVVVFCQKAHGQVFTSKTKVDDIKNFNIGIGQLITMKKNEIAIRREDIKSMKDVVSECQMNADFYQGTTAGKLWTNFIQITTDKIKMSYNHIHELEDDLESLYNGTYITKPYAEVLTEHRAVRNGDENAKKEITRRPYVVPQEIVDGTHIYEIVGGGAKLKKL